MNKLALLLPLALLTACGEEPAAQTAPEQVATPEPIETLPAPAQDAMAEWLADARARQAAETAANELSQRLTAN